MVWVDIKNKLSLTKIRGFTRGGVEDTTFEANDTKKSGAKAKDRLLKGRPSRGQEEKCSKAKDQEHKARL